MRLFRSRAFAAGNRDDVPHVRRHVRRGVPDHPGVPVRPRLLADLGRAAAAAVLRHADARLAVAGALSDRIGRRPIMVTGLALQALGFAWVAARGSLRTSWVELVVALLVAGVGISMALPTVPTAVLNAVAATRDGQGIRRSTTWPSASAPSSPSRSPAPCSPPTATSATPLPSPPDSARPCGPASCSPQRPRWRRWPSPHRRAGPSPTRPPPDPAGTDPGTDPAGTDPAGTDPADVSVAA